jgi:hypothetical protein
LAIKVWPEMHENLKRLSQIGGPLLKFKNLKQFLFRTKNYPKNLMRQSLLNTEPYNGKVAGVFKTI